MTVARRRHPRRAVEEVGLLHWLDAPREDAGMRFAVDGGDEWSFWSYARLAARAGAAAARIRELAERPGGNVSIAVATGPDFVAMFVGALIAGYTPSPLALPLFARDRRRYVEHVAGILEVAQPALIVTDEPVRPVLDEAAAEARLSQRSHVLALDDDGDADAARARRGRPDELALLQFTSGSSGRPRGVRVSWSNLEADIAMIRAWLEMEPGDQTASWLPLYHDMGLIGAFLTPLLNTSDVWVMRPDQFIADPLRWLECFGRRGSQLAVAPNFGFAYAAKRIADEQLEGMDFSAWRAAIVGAERLDPAVLGGFARRLAPYGFRPETFLPAYGLAEATLAVTGVELERVPTVVRPDWSRALPGDELRIEDRALLTDLDRIGGGDGWLVGCGAPFERVAVEIVDDDGGALPEGHLGEIVVDGPIVAGGYERGGGGPTAFVGERVRTGDAGFLLDGELFVLGRLGDSVKARGRTVFVEDVEARLAGIDGIQKGKCVVLAGSDGPRQRLVAVVEAAPGEWADAAAKLLRTEAGRELEITVLAGGPGAIERTSSGKPRRRVMWRQLLAGTLPATVVRD